MWPLNLGDLSGGYNGRVGVCAMALAKSLGGSCGLMARMLILGVDPSGSGEEVGGVILSMITEVDGRISIVVG